MNIPPNFLKTLKWKLENNPEASWAYTGYDRIWVNDGEEDQQEQRVEAVGGQAWDPELLQKINYISMCSLIRHDVIRGYEFDEEIPRLQDWDLWLSLIKEGRKGVLVGGTRFRAYATGDGITGGSVSWNDAVNILRAKHGF